MLVVTNHEELTARASEARGKIVVYNAHPLRSTG